MPSDFIIFLKYVFNVRGFFEDLFNGIKALSAPKNMANMFLLLAALSLIFLKSEGTPLAIILILATVAVYLRVTYLGGAHRHWYRQKIKESTKTEKTVDEIFKKIKEQDGITREEKKIIE